MATAVTAPNNMRKAVNAIGPISCTPILIHKKEELQIAPRVMKTSQCFGFKLSPICHCKGVVAEAISAKICANGTTMDGLSKLFRAAYSTRPAQLCQPISCYFPAFTFLTGNAFSNTKACIDGSSFAHRVEMTRRSQRKKPRNPDFFPTLCTLCPSW